ncbi:MoxR family ATPase [Sulfurimonas sp. HSL3-7]|uniref:MoxR family ATPase n=1 Tax=Sulfonitrofixus jiaomeiensis TaxID=3131938 RepID=UPI0031F76FE3
MYSKEVTSSLTAMIKAQIPTFLWGPPGIGKSSIVKQIAQANAYEFIDLRLSLMDPTDLKGIPFYDKEAHQALWAPPSFLPREGRGILFLDELNSAPPAVQASAYQLILDRKVGEYTLPEGWAIIAAGNREGDRGVVYRMPSPLANRFVHLEMDVNVEDWRDWAYGAGMDERVIAYIGYKSDDLFSFDPTKNEKSFATPRSWEFVSSVLRSEMDEKLLLETIGGAIGKDRAVRFLSFAKVMHKLPDIAAILSGGEGAYPEEVEVLHALATGLVMAIRENFSKERMDNLLHYTLGLQSEFAVMIVQDLQRAGYTMEDQKVFDKWVAKFAYLLA